MLVLFGFTYCPDICPTTLFHVSEILNGLGPAASQVQPIFITIDPKRDTPDKLRAYTTAFDRRIVGLTGTETQIAAAAKSYRAHYAKIPIPGSKDDYTFEHQAGLYLMNADGKFITSFTFRDNPKDTTDAIRRHLDR